MSGGVQMDFETLIVPADNPLLPVPADDPLLVPPEELVIYMLDDDNTIEIGAN
jgi:hypothetical protein